MCHIAKMAGCVPSYNIAFAGVFGVGKTSLFEALKHSRCNETICDETGRSGRWLDKWTHRTVCDSGEPIEVAN